MEESYRLNGKRCGAARQLASRAALTCPVYRHPAQFLERALLEQAPKIGPTFSGVFIRDAPMSRRRHERIDAAISLLFNWIEDDNSRRRSFILLAEKSSRKIRSR